MCVETNEQANITDFFMKTKEGLVEHSTGRALSSDWFEHSFIIAVYEHMIDTCQ